VAIREQLLRAGRPIAIYLASRVLVLVAAATIDFVAPKSSLMDSLGRWDGAWYLRIAQTGYPHSVNVTQGLPGQNTIAFFPLFPLIVRALHSVLTWNGAFELVVLVTGLAAAIGLWMLTAQVYDDRAADRATLLFCFFPGSIVFALFYSEGLMLVLAIACLWALLRHKWLIAGIAAGLATATRPNAAVLVLCCAWAAAQAIRHRREWWALVSVVLAPVGAVVYFAFLAARTGVKTAWFREEHSGWQEGFDFGRSTLHKLNLALQHPLHDVSLLVGALCFLFLLACLPYVWKAELPAELLIFGGGIVVLALGAKSLGLRPRFLLSAFPLFMALGARLPTRAYRIVLAVGAGLLPMVLLLSLKTTVLTP
jgi:Gpi18-like mannosyltransferase